MSDAPLTAGSTVSLLPGSVAASIDDSDDGKWGVRFGSHAKSGRKMSTTAGTGRSFASLSADDVDTNDSEGARPTRHRDGRGNGAVRRVMVSGGVLHGDGVDSDEEGSGMTVSRVPGSHPGGGKGRVQLVGSYDDSRGQRTRGGGAADDVDEDKPSVVRPRGFGARGALCDSEVLRWRGGDGGSRCVYHDCTT